MSTFQDEVDSGKRFQFGKNWQSFLATVNDERIAIAERSILELLREQRLDGLRVIDVGSGSGLFSLAARRLGAQVVSFDYDPSSVACAQELKQRYFPHDPSWTILEGSVLETEFLGPLGQFDLVYSWGVLHHTGDMWTALRNASTLVNPDGKLVVAIYNNQGIKSALWKRVKQTYCSGPVGQAAMGTLFVPYFFGVTVAASVVSRRNLFAEYKKNRGMSVTHDWTDWLGGLPFEVASVEEIFSFFKGLGFDLFNIKTTNSLGNNQFVFVRTGQ